jgi:hypothetical protein
VIAGLFCGFLEEGDPDKDLAFDIIIVFSIDIISCFILGLGFQIYLINLKYGKNKEGSIAPMTINTTQNHTENQGNARNDTQMQLKNQNYNGGDEEDSPTKLNQRGDLKKNITSEFDTNFTSSVKAAMDKNHVVESTKESNSDLVPNIHFTKKSVEKSKDYVDDEVDVFGGNL